jgi:hypothetical protein
MLQSICMPGTTGDHRCVVVRGRLGISGVQVRILQMAFENTLLQAVRNNHVRYAAVELEHPLMAVSQLRLRVSSAGQASSSWLKPSPDTNT